MLSAALAMALLVSGAAPRAPTPTDDVVLDALNSGFFALRRGDHAQARKQLERATARFDALALDGSALEKAFASDASKPYRGRPHERVLAEAVLAALDAERGRCDLAVPALHQAAFLDAKQSPHDTSDAVLVHALLLRCLTQLDVAAGDVERARNDLRSAAGEHATAVEALALGDDLDLVLDGIGPTVRADGNSGERTVVVPSAHPAAATGTRAKPTTPAARIHLGGAAHSAEGTVVWSSTLQASTVQGRPFEQVLAERAAFRSQSIARGTDMVQKGVRTGVDSGVRGKLDARAAIASLLFAGAGVGLTAVGAVTDPRADERCVEDLFERALLVGH